MVEQVQRIGVVQIGPPACPDRNSDVSALNANPRVPSDARSSMAASNVCAPLVIVRVQLHVEDAAGDRVGRGRKRRAVGNELAIGQTRVLAPRRLDHRCG